MKFGPSGNGILFTAEGHNSSVEAPAWLKNKGLELYEYSFGRGVRISSETASEIGAEALKNNIEISVHSPYYINFASENEDNIKSSIGYLLTSIKMLKMFNGKRCVVHPGSPMKQSRDSAMNRLITNFNLLAQVISDSKNEDILICPETMGKKNQMGSLPEILRLCQIADFFIPCIDFGHLNARNKGYLQTRDNYRQIFDIIFNMLGEEKAKKIHMHFSHIEYGEAGEVKHLSFEDTKYGPFFKDLVPVLYEYGIDGHIICESNGTQVEDAIDMKDNYNLFTLT